MSAFPISRIPRPALSHMHPSKRQWRTLVTSVLQTENNQISTENKI